MGGEPYWYVVSYQEDIQAALDQLREREFRAGRYSPVEPFPRYATDPETGRWSPTAEPPPGPGAGHASIEEAIADAAEDGTRSILDIFSVAEEPGIGATAPFPDETLREYFGTTTPSRADVFETDWGGEDDFDRGESRYVVIYEDGRPQEIFFFGCSFD